MADRYHIYEPTPAEIAAECEKIRAEPGYQKPKKSEPATPYTPRTVRDPKLCVLAHRSWR